MENYLGKIRGGIIHTEDMTDLGGQSVEIDLKTESGRLACRWTFKDSFIALPEPGDDFFNDLYKCLLTYEVQLTSMSYNPEGDHLAEAALLIPLLGGRLRLKIAYGWVEFEAHGGFDEAQEPIPGICESLFPVLQDMGADINNGQATIYWQGFIQANNLKSNDLFDAHFPINQSRPYLAPEGFIYKVKLNDSLGNADAKMVVARSLAPNYPESLYTEITLNYSSTGEIGQFNQQYRNDFWATLKSLTANFKAKS